VNQLAQANAYSVQGEQRLPIKVNKDCGDVNKKRCTNAPYPGAASDTSYWFLGRQARETLLLTTLAKKIESGRERIVLAQHSAKIKLVRSSLISLTTRPEQCLYGSQRIPEVTMRELVKTALRYRSDRLIIREVRGPGAWDLVQALNTGHGGSMSTIHANSANDALPRNRSRYGGKRWDSAAFSTDA
jgi:hypothetical protein